MAFLNNEKETYSYDISGVCNVHYEPLNLYSTHDISSISNLNISIINDISNIERALALLKANAIIDDYTMEGFNISSPNDYITTSKGVTISCIDSGLLTHVVDDGGVAVIPGNFALTSWGATKASEYTILSETSEVAGKNANVLAVKSKDINNDKTKALMAAFKSEDVKNFIEETFGTTVVYYYSSLI